MKRFTLLLTTLLVLFSLTLSACAPAATPEPTAAPATKAPPTAVPPTAVPPTEVPPTAEPTAIPGPANPNLILATTTSTQDSGLLDVLIPLFESQTGYKVQTVAVGSGAAIQMGQEGNADVLLVHSPAAEYKFMDEGWGKERLLVMHNDFIMVGPAADPAGIKGKGPSDAMKAILAGGDADPTKVLFLSRADKSGTHTKELDMWKKATLDPAGTKPAWYMETGQGMGATLTIASEKGGYTLTDRATYLASKANLQLEILLEGNNALLNVYHVMTVDPGKWPKVNYDGALAFANFMIAPATQEEIGKFGMEKYGQALFFPDATKTDADLGLKPPAPASAAALTVTGLVTLELKLSDADLKALTVVEITAEHPKSGSQKYSGVKLSELLAKAQLKPEAKTLVFTASDGFSAELDVATVNACADCLVAFTDAAGVYQLVMSGQSSKLWVKTIIKIEAK
jgi:tungstate transport system substrate-binding protein